jgi:hypothetical protein
VRPFRNKQFGTFILVLFLLFRKNTHFTWDKRTQSGTGMLRYRTEIQVAGMPMPAALSSMPMPSYAFYHSLKKRLRIIAKQLGIRKGKSHIWNFVLSRIFGDLQQASCANKPVFELQAPLVHLSGALSRSTFTPSPPPQIKNWLFDLCAEKKFYIILMNAV